MAVRGIEAKTATGGPLPAPAGHPARRGMKRFRSSAVRAWSSLALILLVSGAGEFGPRAEISGVQAPLPLQASHSEIALPQLLPAVPTDSPEPITPIPPPPPANPLKLALGESLFEDPLLSRDRTRSCRSCHDTRSNGANAHRHDRGLDGSEIFFNTNTVFNAALSFRFNWEGDITSLRAHIEASMVSPRTMGMTMDEVLGRLGADPEMVARFSQAYGHDPDQPSLLDAIAIYERSLVTPGSRFDQWLEGDGAALSADEQKGYGLFKSLGCISCHQGVNVGGNLFERQGIFRPLAAPKPEVLRVPSLRNVAVTAPYFHDGSAATLEDAVRKMAASQLDRKLSTEQVGSIVAFLRTLTGTYRGTPVTAAPVTAMEPAAATGLGPSPIPAPPSSATPTSPIRASP
jgi:cytochrome c peroxidase